MSVLGCAFRRLANSKPNVPVPPHGMTEPAYVGRECVTVRLAGKEGNRDAHNTTWKLFLMQNIVVYVKCVWNLKSKPKRAV